MSHVGGDNEIGGLADLVNESRNGMEESTNFYADPSSRPDGMSDGEAAYYLLMHAGMLHRYTDDLGHYDQIEERIPDRKGLVIAAAIWASGSGCVEQAKLLLARDDVDEDDREDVEDLLLLLDELYVFLMALYALSSGFHDDAEVVTATAKARAVFDELGTVLRENPVDCVLAAGPLLALREHIQLPIKPEQWWLCSEKDWVQRFEDSQVGPVEAQLAQYIQRLREMGSDQVRS